MKLLEVTPPKQSIWTASPTGDIDVESKDLTTLQGAPSRVQKDFYCSQNKLTSFQYAPQYIGGSLWAWGNQITSLHNIHKQIHYIGGDIHLYHNPIKSHMLGLCLIKEWKTLLFDSEDPVTIGPVDQIFNKYHHDINLCQEALIDAGYSHLAKI